MNPRSESVRYVMEPTASELGIDRRQVNEIREFARVMSTVDLSDRDRLDSARLKLYRLLGLGDPPAVTKPKRATSVATVAPKRVKVEPGDPTESDWQWDTGRPQWSAGVWARSLIRCRHISATPKMLGWAMREVGDTRDGTAYLSEADGIAMLGLAESTIEGHRKTLREAGWIRESGKWTSGGHKKWRLTVPRCCEDLDNPDPATDDG